MYSLSNTQRVPVTEITLRAVLLAILLTAILAASNVYLALKLGHTIAASIPAAVLSMAILRFFRNSTIFESNLVQTSASAGEGVAAAVSFILPALIITGYWQHFYYWQTVLLVFIGGMLGLFFSVPLRKILLNHSDLTFPEGTAIGQVLRVSINQTENFRNLLIGGFLGGIISLFQVGFKLISENWHLWWVKNRILFGTSLGFSPALLAAGFIVGIQASVSMFIGFLLGWVVGIPMLTWIYTFPEQSPYDLAMQLWSQHIRFIGVGTMLAGGAWTLLILIKPIVKGLKMSFVSIYTMKTQRANEAADDRDLPIRLIAGGVIIFSILSLATFFYLLGLQQAIFPFPIRFALSLFATLFTLVGGFFLASICAYLSGLVGMTNNPLSGLMIIAVLLISSILSLSLINSPSLVQDDITFVILITTMVAIITAIAGENIQDLKAGQIIKATPWKQQIMIMIGVVVAAFVVEPILDILFQAYGIGGVFPRPLMDRTQMLPAPQAGLMTAVAQGVFGNSLPWAEIVIGCLIALVGIVADEILKKYNKRLPILAIGLGIYLPPDIILPVVLGGFVNYLVKRKLSTVQDSSFESGTVLACGIVAGSALMGVILAIPFVVTGNSDAIKLLPNSLTFYANVLGIITTFFLCQKLYKTSVKKKIVRT